MPQYLIITADDFGLHASVNEAVEQAARVGVLTAASLMVSGAVAADAIERARRLPTLHVGLHVVLADGYATLAREAIPQLADERGFITDEMIKRSFQIAFLPRLRHQMEMEIHAQFRAFFRSGLRLDHVNVHKHFHLHPVLLSTLIRIAKQYGVRAIRVPDEPAWFAARRSWPAAAGAGLLQPLIAHMKYRLRAAGISHNDHLFGIAASGAMNKDCLLGILRALPQGVTEIYLHPATVSGHAVGPSMASYEHAQELSALLSDEVSQALANLNVPTGGYANLSGTPIRLLA